MIRLLPFLLLMVLRLPAQPPQLKGGLEAFLSTNTISPPYSRQNCIQGTIELSFKLNREGKVYFASVSKAIGTDLDDEALRLLKLSSGKWQIPAQYDTLAMLLIPVKFSLPQAECRNKDKQQIMRAITAYKAKTELTRTIAQYYRQKEQGRAKKADEIKIILLKEELGIDEDYLDAKIASGMKKIKQEDKEGACADFKFVKYMGSAKADDMILKYCN